MRNNNTEPRSHTSFVPILAAAALMAAALAPATGRADALLLAPSDGQVIQAQPCPFPSCLGRVPVRVWVSGGDPVVEVAVTFMEVGGDISTRRLCGLPDPIEPSSIEECPPPPFEIRPSENVGDPSIRGTLVLPEGGWTAIARADRAGAIEESPPVAFAVVSSNPTPPGPVSLESARAPAKVPDNWVSPIFRLREPDPGYPDGLFTEPDEIVLTGENLGSSINPFLEFYAAPIPFLEPSLSFESALPADDYCRYGVENVQELGDGQVSFTLPELPLTSPAKCGFSPSPPASIFQLDWRVLVRDPWGLPDRDPIHTWWAIPSPRDVPWAAEPPLRIVKPAYPLIDGFDFFNVSTSSSYDEFLTVYGNNAYICLGAFGVCATRVPDPLYHTLWYGVYRLVISQTGGSCNGLSATSLLFAREDLQTEDFNPLVRFPAGWDRPGEPFETTTYDNGTPKYLGIAKYRDTNFCTPFCSPRKPDNLWATVRMNHGVQISREFIAEIVDTLGEGIFDDLSSIKGFPDVTLERVRNNPQSYVMCFFGWGNGHCVTPYRVDGDKIYVYDNNYPGNTDAYIEISGGEYYYPEREDQGSELFEGDAIVAFPISIWKNGRNLWGIDLDLVNINSELVLFLLSVAVGSADMQATDANGGSWGWNPDGSFDDALPGAVSLPPLGPQDGAPARSMPLMLPMNQPSPTIRLHAKGGRYTWHSAAGGHQMQVESADAQAGDEDTVELGYDDDGLTLRSFSFSPESATGRIVPRVGLAMGEQDRALFQWQGLSVPAARAVGFSADRDERSAGFDNDSGQPTQHLLVMDHVAGAASSNGRMIYGPFEVPDGATQTVVLDQWPDVATVRADYDFDRDGVVDHSETVRGVAADTPVLLGAEADLALAKTASPQQAALGEPVTFTIVVTNNGPDDATAVKVVDTLPVGGATSGVSSTQGSCITDAGALVCDLGALGVGAGATISYVVTPESPGILANAATVFGVEGDPDQSNNGAVASADVPMPFDIKPKDLDNRVNLRAQGVLPVAILGGPGYDVTEIAWSSLRFGPGDAAPAHGPAGHVEDVNGDGEPDLVVHFPIQASALIAAESQACVTGRFADGRSFSGCDFYEVVP
jgi:uncharacterized repeat protein (TIGR01451 family)